MGFKKGQDPNRNLNGRPKKGETFSDVFEKYIKDKKGIDSTEWLVDKLCELAEKGSERAITYLADRVWGKVKEKHELSTGDGGGINIVIEKYTDEV